MRRWREKTAAGGARAMRAEMAERARNALLQIELNEGLLVAAVVKGEACCRVNDPDYDKGFWTLALVGAREAEGSQEREPFAP